MDGRKLRDYYLSFYAPKFLIPISRSRLSVVMSHFLISARSDYYAIEPLYKTLISRYMSCGGELATLPALFLAPLARHGPQDQPGARRTIQSWSSYSQVDYCLRIHCSRRAVTDFSSLLCSFYYSTLLLQTLAQVRNMAFANKQLDEQIQLLTEYAIVDQLYPCIS